MKVTIFGAGYVGLTTASVIAANHEVTLVDIDTEKIEKINEGVSPIKEDGIAPRLEEAIKDKRLQAVGLDHNFDSQDVVLVCVNTPANNDGSVNLTEIRNVIELIDNNFDNLMNDFLIVSVRSTVPPGTTRFLVLDSLKAKHKPNSLGVIFQPEFLRQGKAVSDILNPDRIIIGASDEKTYDIYKSFVISNTLHKDIPFFKMSIESAEMCKYVSNCFLATKISFSNEMASLAETIPNVNIDEVIDGLLADHRVCPSHLRPGLGYGGSCLPKDVTGLKHFGQSRGVPLRLLTAVHDVNNDTTDRLVSLLGAVINKIQGEKIAILGAAFKAGTDDMRNSPSYNIIKKLVSLGAEICIHDPFVDLESSTNLHGLNVNYSESVEDCTADAIAVFLMTDWDMYLDMGLEQITTPMKNKLFIDGRRFFTGQSIPDDVTYRAIGTLYDLS